MLLLDVRRATGDWIGTPAEDCGEECAFFGTQSSSMSNGVARLILERGFVADEACAGLTKVECWALVLVEVGEIGVCCTDVLLI